MPVTHLRAALICALITIFLAISGSVATRAAVVYVNPVAVGLNNGTSWANAFTDLQVALGAAVAGDQLWVVVGTYYPHASDRTVSFQLKNGVVIYGGFVGTETLLSQRGNFYATILSGELGTPDNYSDNSYHVVDGSGTNATAVLDGCTVTRGAAYLPNPDGHGGGIYCDAGSPTLRNISVTDNVAYYEGGGIFLRNNSNPSLTFVDVFSNMPGGASFYDSDPTLNFCNFRSNQSGGSGAAIYMEYSSPVMTNIICSDNTADFQAGGIHCYASSPTLTNALFLNNTADQFGGGMALTDFSNPNLINVTFTGNTATTQAGGGMVVQVGSAPVIVNSIFWGNSSGTGSPEIDILIAGGSPVVSYSIIDGGIPPGVTDAGNNSSADPLFRATGDVRLSPFSPGIDAGNTAANSEPFDLLFKPRVSGAAIDLGAYEYACPPGPVVYVDGNSFSTAEGTSWATAMRSLQDAIETVEYCAGANEIWVADATYRTSGLPADRSLSFELRDGVAIYGGFNGTETARSQRDWTVNQSILTGEIGMAPYQPDNAYHVVKGDGVGPTAVLDGFTIEAGYADGAASDGDGAGIYLTNANPTLANLVVRDNEATGDGGGIAAVAGSAPVIRDSRFESNTAAALGGGAYYHTSAPTLVNVVFEANTANDAGAGITNWNANQLQLTNCIFLGNIATNGGGGIYNFQSFPKIVNGSFFNNDGGLIGGAILNIEFSTPDVVNSILYGNTASFGGSEIYNDNMFGGATSTNVIHSLVAGCGGSGGGWVPAIGADGGGNIDTNPQFRDPGIGNLDLNFSSPCINVGDNGHNAEGLDIVGNPRYVNTVIDMGAYEYPAPVGIGDLPPSADAGIQSTVPNPFNPSVTIHFALKQAGHVDMHVYNVRGARVAILVNETLNAGAHSAKWDGRDNNGRQMASGVYLVRLVSSDGGSTRKIVMIK